MYCIERILILNFKVLIVDDYQPIQDLLQEIVTYHVPNSEISLASTLEEAIPKVSRTDLVITDFEYPSEGFLGLLPTLQKERRPFILQSGSLGNIKIFDDTLQLAAIHKNCHNFCTELQKVLTHFIL